MAMRIAEYEKETIILFNEADPMAEIYTHNKAWQQHLEKKLGLEPIATNSQGGKTYAIDKKRVKPPKAPKKLSEEAKAKLAERLAKMRHLRSGK
jgi:ribosome biogenesis GTPase A